MENKYKELRLLDVSAHTEKKANLSYLSWVWAVDQLLQQDPAATWEYREPVRFGNNSLMVFCTVNAFNKSMTAQLPVMDHKNKAIPDPDAFEVNKAMQRCLAKAIALHGIGLYIYAGEDLPEAPAAQKIDVAKHLEVVKQKIDALQTTDALSAYWNEATAGIEEEDVPKFTDAFKARAAAINKAKKQATQQSTATH